MIIAQKSASNHSSHFPNGLFVFIHLDKERAENNNYKINFYLVTLPLVKIDVFDVLLIAVLNIKRMNFD